MTGVQTCALPICFPVTIAVVKNGEKKSGVTIHYVNENYDEGEKILIKELLLDENETAETLENRIKDLEKIAIVEAFKKVLEER